MHRYGDARVVDSVVRHTKGPVCAAIPKRDWEFPISTIKLIGEFTTPGGPIFDYFYIFVAGKPPRMFQVPMESFEPVGLSTFFADLEAALPGSLSHRLANSVSHASSIMWPEPLAGQRLFDYLPVQRRGPIGKLLDRLRPRYLRALAAPAQAQLGCNVEWAV
jgi:hypothetical protein